MKKYEHLVVDRGEREGESRIYDSGELQAQLNRHGQLGWQLCEMTTWCYIFVRELQPTGATASAGALRR